MKITIQNSNGIKLCSFRVCAEYGYEQFIIDNSLEGCKVIDGNHEIDMIYPNSEEITIQLA
jgi:hypothetical protein|tara:strand:- start:2538 stop:2720 length:183 start_codon:yes stop_codon:yes gene_type:complete